VTDAAVARVQGKAPAECMWDDSLGAGLQMALFDLAGKAAGVPEGPGLGIEVDEVALRDFKTTSTQHDHPRAIYAVGRANGDVIYFCGGLVDSLPGVPRG